MSTSLHQICDASSREWIDFALAVASSIIFFPDIISWNACCGCLLFQEWGFHTCAVLSAPCLASLWSVYSYSGSGQLRGKHFTSHATFLGEGVARIGLKQALHKMYGVYDTLWHLRGLLFNHFIPILRVGDSYTKNGLSAFS